MKTEEVEAMAGALYEHGTYETPEEAAPRIRAVASMANMHGQTDRLSQRNLPALYGEQNEIARRDVRGICGAKMADFLAFPKSETKRIFGVCA